ncbi:insulin-like growth factor-binding protein 6 [Pholidichthys leucotaenia]
MIHIMFGGEMALHITPTPPYLGRVGWNLSLEDNYQGEMSPGLNILVLLLLHTALPSPLSAPPAGCGTCKGRRPQGPASGGRTPPALALGEPCGVYTVSCGRGLRCTPPRDDARPLRALLEGRGACGHSSVPIPAEGEHTVEPASAEHPEEAPCRKLLTTLIKGFGAQLFQSHHDIYMPNCDKWGFFRKKQCWSSRNKQRGKCWCVDENGMPVSTNAKHKGGLRC